MLAISLGTQHAILDLTLITVHIPTNTTAAIVTVLVGDDFDIDLLKLVGKLGLVIGLGGVSPSRGRNDLAHGWYVIVLVDGYRSDVIIELEGAIDTDDQVIIFGGTVIIILVGNLPLLASTLPLVIDVVYAAYNIITPPLAVRGGYHAVPCDH